MKEVVIHHCIFVIFVKDLVLHVKFNSFALQLYGRLHQVLMDKSLDMILNFLMWDDLQGFKMLIIMLLMKERGLHQLQ